MLTPNRRRDVYRGRLLPIVERGGWTFSAIEEESRRQGTPLATSVLSRINRGAEDLSAHRAAILGAILGLDPLELRLAVNGAGQDPNGSPTAPEAKDKVAA